LGFVRPLLIDGAWEPIMVCPECGEETCGAVVARISAQRGLVTWAVFGWYDGHEVTIDDSSIAPIHFEFRAYRQTLATPN
jgi:hypothetical protein